MSAVAAPKRTSALRTALRSWVRRRRALRSIEQQIARHIDSHRDARGMRRPCARWDDAGAPCDIGKRLARRRVLARKALRNAESVLEMHYVQAGGK